MFCNGTITRNTGAQLRVNGGVGRNNGAGERGGGGGGGVCGLFAKTFAGTGSVRNVAGGTATAPATAGGAGYDIGEITLSEEIINSILLGAVA